MLGIFLYMGPPWAHMGPMGTIWGPWEPIWGPMGSMGRGPMGQGRWARADGPRGPPRGGIFQGPRPMGLKDPPVGVYFRARGRWGPMGSMGLGDPPIGVRTLSETVFRNRADHFQNRLSKPVFRNQSFETTPQNFRNLVSKTVFRNQPFETSPQNFLNQPFQHPSPPTSVEAPWETDDHMTKLRLNVWWASVG